MKFYGEILIFVLLFIINIRVFFVNSVKRDPLVVIAPVTFILSVFLFFSWGFSVFTVSALVISFLVLLSNFHALFRYSESLYIDHYSALMKVWAIFTSLLSLAAFVLLIVFYPVDLKNRSVNVKETRVKYTGSFASGFEPSRAFEKVSATMYEFRKNDPLVLDRSKDDTDYKALFEEERAALWASDDEKTEKEAENKTLAEDKNKTEAEIENKTDAENKETLTEDKKEEPLEDIILFVSDKRADTYNYRPYLQFMASKGYTVVSADFYPTDSKWFHTIKDRKTFRQFFLMHDSLKNKDAFWVNKELYTFNVTRELDNMLLMIRERYGKECKIFLVSDKMSNDAAYDFMKKHPETVTGLFKIDSVTEYLTPGYGFIAETNPLLNASLGFETEKDFSTPLLLADKTIEEFERATNKKAMEASK